MTNTENIINKNKPLKKTISKVQTGALAWDVLYMVSFMEKLKYEDVKYVIKSLLRCNDCMEHADIYIKQFPIPKDQSDLKGYIRLNNFRDSIVEEINKDLRSKKNFEFTNLKGKMGFIDSLRVFIDKYNLYYLLDQEQPDEVIVNSNNATDKQIDEFIK